MSITDLGTTSPDLTGYEIVAGVEANTFFRYVAPDPGGSWKDPSFDDSAWSSATAWPFSYPANGATLWPPNSNQGPGYTAAVRWEMPAGIGDGYWQVAADDSVVVYINNVQKINKAQPASARWYSVTADEWAVTRKVAARPVDDLGNLRSFFWYYYMLGGLPIEAATPLLRQRQRAL